MKKIVYLLGILCFIYGYNNVICCRNNIDNPPITINSDVPEEYIWKQSPFLISTEIENDTNYRMLLSDYMYYCLINENLEFPNNDSLRMLFSRPSFKIVTEYILNDPNSNTLNIFYPDSPDTWDDYKYNILYNCNDTATLYYVANKLLTHHNINGLLGLWLNCNWQDIPVYNDFLDWAISNNKVFDITTLIIISHNSGNIKEKERLLKILKEKDYKLYCKLDNYILTKKKISNYDYLFEFLYH